MCDKTNKKSLQLMWPASLFLLIVSTTSLACIWSLFTDHSVRFNSFTSGRGFYRLPPLPEMYDGKTGRQYISQYQSDTGFFEDEASAPFAQKKIVATKITSEEIWKQANKAEETKDWINLQKLLQQYLHNTEAEFTNDSLNPSLPYPKRNSAYDRLDALSSITQGVKSDVLKEYLDARLAYENEEWNSAEEFLTKISDKNLADNAMYLRAAILSKTDRPNEAVQLFQQLLRKYPNSEKVEVTEYMIARLYLQLNRTAWGYDPLSYGDAKKVSPDQVKDMNWHEAEKRFKLYLSRFPNGRFATDARGWLAHLYVIGADRAAALTEYYRLLGHPTSWAARIEAKKSLAILGHKCTDDELDQLEKNIAGEPQAAMAYAYHRIYNYAVDLTYTKSQSWYGENNWEEKNKEEKRVTESHQAGTAQLERIAKFATAMMQRYPQNQVSGGFVLRVAQAQFELQNYAEALALAKKALRLNLTGESRAQALWVQGSAEHQMKNYKNARAAFKILIADFPDSHLIEGARRLLAMTAEDQGDLETALEQYLQLNYHYDIAYFVDVLMPIERLKKFIEKHQTISGNNELLYSLGLRLMREKKWQEARTTLHRVQPRSLVSYEEDRYPIGSEDGSVSRKHKISVKASENYYEKKEGIKPTWLLRDLKTIDDLEHLEKNIESAQDDEAKAEAMYQLASYQFDADSLTFYNSALWCGQRYWLLSSLDNSEHLRLPNESRILFDYSLSHETLARAIPIYEDIVQRYPNTKAAKDALYSAAVAHQHLSNLNPYWRSIYENGLYAGNRIVTYAIVRSTYPKYQFPRGTNGWEASSRTVNGGPGWAAPPKPLPKITRTEKYTRLLKHFLSAAQTAIQPKVNLAVDAYTTFWTRCLYAVVIACGLIFVWYGTVLGLHVWKHRSASATVQLSLSDTIVSAPPTDTDSPVEKMIRDE